MEVNLKRNFNLISLQHGALNFAAILFGQRSLGLTNSIVVGKENEAAAEICYPLQTTKLQQKYQTALSLE